MQKLQSKPYAVVTSCTSRKVQLGGRAALRSSESVCSVQEMSLRWRDALEGQQARTPARALYQGRAFREAEAAANMIDAELFVVSAGLGLVSGDENVPAYDLTISAGAGSIAPTLRRLGATDQAWWQALIVARDQGHPLSGLVGNDDIEQVWIAMPSTYLSMVASELSAVDAGVARRKLRIFSSSKSQEVLPEHLLPCLMPYDTRLEAAGFAGTTSDFPQRCLLHFAKALSGRGTSLDDARSRVLAALEGLNAPTKPERRKLEDAEIIHVLRQQWQQHQGSSTKLLRYLRDGAGIACEQGRFRQLWLGLKQERQADALRS